MPLMFVILEKLGTFGIITLIFQVEKLKPRLICLLVHNHMPINDRPMILTLEVGFLPLKVKLFHNMRLNNGREM